MPQYFVSCQVRWPATSCRYRCNINCNVVILKEARQ